jgi:uracil-DNA glycosylase family 4
LKKKEILLKKRYSVKNAMADSSRFKAMKAIRDEILALKKSPLYEYRTESGYLPVIGEGSHDANVMFVGEAPGLTEAKTGRPFCGRSGKFLDEMLASIGLDRQDVYITNVVKDRPQDNRDPEPEEIALYGPYLLRQIDIIQPKVIATLGRISMAYLFEHFGLKDVLQPVGKIHGKTFLGSASYGGVTLVPLYHPAVALYNGSSRQTLLDDFQVLKKYL